MSEDQGCKEGCYWECLLQNLPFFSLLPPPTFGFERASTRGVKTRDVDLYTLPLEHGTLMEVLVIKRYEVRLPLTERPLKRGPGIALSNLRKANVALSKEHVVQSNFGKQSCHLSGAYTGFRKGGGGPGNC